MLPYSELRSKLSWNKMWRHNSNVCSLVKIEYLMCNKICQWENYSIELNTDHQKDRCSEKDQCSKTYLNIQNILKHLEQLADSVSLRNILTKWVFCFIIWKTKNFMLKEDYFRNFYFQIWMCTVLILWCILCNF